MRALKISHVAYPTLTFDTPSRKVEFVSERARRLGLPALPVNEESPASAFPLSLRQGRTLTAFHGFYDHGRALPTLARADPEPYLWMSPADADARGVSDGAGVRLHNERGAMLARARVTDKIPAGTVWMRDGWAGLNVLTSGAAVLGDEAVDIFAFAAGQASFEARVEVTAATS
jgi:anaerobic selenocysteine-containing dehydrogenase